MCDCDFCDDADPAFGMCEFCATHCPQGVGWEARTFLGLMRWQNHRCKAAVEDIGGDPLMLIDEAKAHRLDHAVNILYEAHKLTEEFDARFPYVPRGSGED